MGSADVGHLSSGLQVGLGSTTQVVCENSFENARRKRGEVNRAGGS